MHETGIVTAVYGEWATVSIRRADGCEKCGICRMGKGEVTIRVKNVCNARIADRVSVSMGTESFLKASLLFYGLPFLGMVAGFTAGYYLAGWARLKLAQSLAGFALGIAFTVLVYLFIKKREPKWALAGFSPVMDKIVTNWDE